MVPAYQAGAVPSIPQPRRGSGITQAARLVPGVLLIHPTAGAVPGIEPASHRAAPASIQHSRAGNHTPTGRRGNSEARRGSRHPQQPTAGAVPVVLPIKPRRFHPSHSRGEDPTSTTNLQGGGCPGCYSSHSRGGAAHPSSNRGEAHGIEPASHRAAPASIQHSRAGNHTPTGRRGNSEARRGSRHPQQPTAGAVPVVLPIKPRRFHPSTNRGEDPASLSVTKIPTNDSLI